MGGGEGGREEEREKGRGEEGRKGESEGGREGGRQGETQAASAIVCNEPHQVSNFVAQKTSHKKYVCLVCKNGIAP